MTIKQLIKKLDKIVNESGELVLYSKYNDEIFAKYLLEDEIAIYGEDEDDVFALKIQLVDWMDEEESWEGKDES